MNQSALIAGLVLGSNSFHLLTARRDGTQLVREQHIQETVHRMAMSPGALREGVLVMLARGELPGAAVVPEPHDA